MEKYMANTPQTPWKHTLQSHHKHQVALGSPQQAWCNTMAVTDQDTTCLAGSDLGAVPQPPGEGIQSLGNPSIPLSEVSM